MQVPFETKVYALMSTLAFIEDRGPLISAAKLLRVVAHFFSAALLARLLGDGPGLHVCLVDGLDFRSLRAQCRGKRRRLGSRDYGFGRCVLSPC